MKRWNAQRDPFYQKGPHSLGPPPPPPPPFTWILWKSCYSVRYFVAAYRVYKNWCHQQRHDEGSCESHVEWNNLLNERERKSVQCQKTVYQSPAFSWRRSELTDRNVELYPQFFLELITTQLRFHMVSPQLVLLSFLTVDNNMKCSV